MGSVFCWEYRETFITISPMRVAFVYMYCNYACMLSAILFVVCVFFLLLQTFVGKYRARLEELDIKGQEMSSTYSKLLV